MIDNKNILFSIIIPTYNRADMISNSINSVIKQIYTNWELIIVDDGSTDNTDIVINNFKDQRIKYFKTKNQGRSSARNYGIEQAKGNYLCFLDDDDYYYDNFLSEFYNEITLKNYPIAIFMSSQDEESKTGIIIKNEVPNIDEKKINILFSYTNNFQPFCIPKEILLDNKFDPRFELAEDFHLLFRIILKYPLFYIPKSLCVYKIHDEMTMEHEFKNKLFLNLPFNRLDTLDDLFKNHKELMTENKVTRYLTKRYNKVLYFYASSALKLNKYEVSLSFLKKIKKNGSFFKTIYYTLSIILRIPYYYTKSKFKVSR